MALQRNLKALGTFGYQTTTRRNPVYIQYIPRTLRYARTNLEKYPRFARLRELLAAHVDELDERNGARNMGTDIRDGVTVDVQCLCGDEPSSTIDGSVCGANVSSGCRRTSTTASGCRRDHLLEIAAHGFDAVEVFATRTHFDYHNPAAVADLQQWLAEAGLELHGIHAPVGERLRGRPLGSRR